MEASKPKDSETAIKNIELLTLLLVPDTKGILEKRPHGEKNYELAGLYVLREDKPYYDLLKAYPDQRKTIEFFDLRDEFKNQTHFGFIRDICIKGKGPFEYDSKLRVSKNGLLWGIADNFQFDEARELMEGDEIPNFQQFLYDRFQKFLSRKMKGADNPLKRIVTKNEKVFLSDLWDSRIFLSSFEQQPELKDYLCYIEHEEHKEIIDALTIRQLANKLRCKDIYFNEIDYSRWLRDCSIREGVPIKQNPTTNKYWVYKAEAKYFVLKKKGRPRK